MKTCYPRHSERDTMVDTADPGPASLLMTVLAHDLRNYLTPLYGRLALLSKRAAAEQRQHDVELAAQATQSLDHMKQLIDNLLEAERLQQGIFDLRWESVDLRELAHTVAQSLEGTDTPIVVDATTALVIKGDPQRLRQALHNLLANAVAHSPRYAPVLLSLHVLQHTAVLRVSDLGPGIPPELLPRLFQLFTPGPTSQGLGLGLYLAHEIAAAHAGTLSVESRRGAGTCFAVALPLTSGEP